MNHYTYKTVRLLVFAALLVALVAFIASCNSEKTESDWKDVSLSYKVGDIAGEDDGVNTGTIIADDDCLYTELIECTGFKLRRDVSQNVEYEVHYYDASDNYISGETKDLIVYSVSEMPEGAVGIRIVLRSLNDTDMNLFWNKMKYDDILTLSITNVVEAAETANE